jgi:hypothetical protein
MSRHLVLLLALAAAASGCGPYMIHEDHRRLVLASSRPCAQGPFEVRLQAAGARWGEAFILEAHSPRPLRGRYSLSAPGRTVDGAFGGPGPLDNARCVAAPAELPAGPDAPGPAPGEPGPRPRAARVAPPPPPAPAADVPVLVEAPDFSPPPGALPGGLFHISFPSGGLDAPPPLPAGADVVVRLWSDEPNDLSQVFFVLRHVVVRPSVSDEEWVRHVRREEDLRRTRLAREWAKEAVENHRRQRHCEAHHEDEGCWGPGGYEGALARMRRPPAPPPPPQPRVAAQAPPPPPVAKAPGPPPPPRAEVQPPHPSEHAAWVPGYHRWDGFAYRWISGFWRVPEEDRRQRLTATAPAPPPPPRAEAAPPPPAPEAVWVAGAWHWDGAAYVWVRGSWQIPPAAGLVWRPARWLIEGLGVRLDPGAWVHR